MVGEMFNDLLADVVGLEPSGPHQIAKSLRESTVNSLPNESNATTYSLLIFQYLGGGDFVRREDVGEECFKLLLIISTASVVPANV